MTALIFLLITFVNLDYPFIEIISYFTVILAAFVRLLPSANKIILSLMNLAFYKPSLNILFDEIIINKSYLNKNLIKLKKKIFYLKKKLK